MRARFPLGLLLLALPLSTALSACSSSERAGTPSGGGGETTAPGAGGAQAPRSLPGGDCSGGRSCNVPELHTCFQWKTADAEANERNEALCEGYGGTAADGACPTENVVSGCKTALGADGCAVNWGYAPVISDDDVRADCVSQSGELIDK